MNKSTYTVSKVLKTKNKEVFSTTTKKELKEFIQGRFTNLQSPYVFSHWKMEGVADRKPYVVKQFVTNQWIQLRNLTV